MRHSFYSLTVLITIILVSPAMAQMPALDDAGEAFEPALLRLAQTLNRSPRLAIWSGPENRLPVGSGVIHRLESGLQHSLLSLSASPEIQARAELGALISDLSSTGALDSPYEDPIAELLEKVRNVDALVVGNYTIVDHALKLRYRLVSTSGQILAVSPEFDYPLLPVDLLSEPGALSLDAALEEISEALASVVGDKRTLRVDIVRRATSGAVSRFGSYIRASLISRLLAGNERRIGAEPIRILDGVQAESPEITHVVKGEFWQRGSGVSLAITVFYGGDIVASLLRHVRADSIAGLDLSPGESFSALTSTDDIGRPALEIGVSGDMPVVQIGKAFSFDVRLKRTGYLWCFYLQSDGLIRQVIPNPGLLRRRGDNRIESGLTWRLPSADRDGFRLVATHPAGPELLKCMVTDRDVRQELPPGMRGESLEPLPAELGRGLVGIFRSLPDITLAEDSLYVTVVDPLAKGATSGR